MTVKPLDLFTRLEKAKFYQCDCCPEEANCHPLAEMFVCGDGVFCEECWSEGGRTDGIRAALLTPSVSPADPFMWMTSHDVGEMRMPVSSSRNVTAWRQPTDNSGRALVPLYLAPPLLSNQDDPS